jgi:antitoxin PrlF
LPDLEIVIAEMLNPDSEFMPADFDETTVPDPVLGQFLHFLARDIEENPQHLQRISSDLVCRVQSLVSEIEMDLEAPLLDEGE